MNKKRFKIMKRLTCLIIFTLCLAMTLPVSASSFSNETLHYVISYKWGLIHKDAGDATLSLRNSGHNVLLTLTGKTRKWADRVYSVRDTLKCTVASNGFRPVQYTKIAHEGGKYGRDEIKYSYSGNKVTGHCQRLRDKKGDVSKSSKTLSATGPVYDMLSIFYYLRLIDYSRLTKGEVVKSTVFSGSKSETVTIRSVGKEMIKTRDKKEHEAYHIKFKFTTDGKKKSSEDIDCWISADSRHIPLLLIGHLPIGQVKCYYVG